MKLLLLCKLLLTIMLLSSFSMGQNPSRSLNELREDLNYYTNVVNAENMWFLTTAQLGFNGQTTYSTELLPRKDAIRKFINNLKTYGTFNQNTINNDVEQVYRNSENIKAHIRNNIIPQLKYDISQYTKNNSPTYNNIPQPMTNRNDTCSSFSNKRIIWTGTKKDRVRWSCQYDSSTHRLVSETQYVNGKKHGKSIGYYRNGSTHTIQNWWRGKRVGEQITIGEDGKRRCIQFDSKGNTIKGPNVDFYGYYDC